MTVPISRRCARCFITHQACRADCMWFQAYGQYDGNKAWDLLSREPFFVFKSDRSVKDSRSVKRKVGVLLSQAIDQLSKVLPNNGRKRPRLSVPPLRVLVLSESDYVRWDCDKRHRCLPHGLGMACPLRGILKRAFSYLTTPRDRASAGAACVFWFQCLAPLWVRKAAECRRELEPLRKRGEVARIKQLFEFWQFPGHVLRVDVESFGVKFGRSYRISREISKDLQRCQTFVRCFVAVTFATVAMATHSGPINKEGVPLVNANAKPNELLASGHEHGHGGRPATTPNPHPLLQFGEWPAAPGPNQMSQGGPHGRPLCCV